MSDSSTPSNNLAQKLDYRGKNLTNILLTCQEFLESNFQQIQGRELRFDESKFISCTFHAAVVRDSEWKSCFLDNCLGKFADFENTVFSNCEFKQGAFEQASFYSCSFESSTITQLNFQGADLRNCNGS